MKPTIPPLLFLTGQLFSTVGSSIDARNEGFLGSKYRTLGGATGCLGNLDQVLWLSAVLYATLGRSSLQVFPNDVRL